MSNLDNLVAKILADSQAKAKEITDAAKREADAKIAEEVRAATAEGEKIAADAHIEAERTAAQIVQGKTLAIRDGNLGAKREMLDKVFAEALNRLNDMPKEEYLAYLSEYLSKLELNGEEIILPAKYGIASIDEINHKNKLSAIFGKHLNVKLRTDRVIDGGFVLVKEGIEQNHTFEALIGYYRDDLEGEVLKILYADVNEYER